MALCDSRPRVETRILYPGDSVHLQCRHESRAGTIVWQKDNSTVDFTTGRLLLTVDGGVVVVNVRSWRTKHSSPIFTLSSIQATTSDAGLYGCSSQGQIVVLYKLIIDDGTVPYFCFTISNYAEILQPTVKSRPVCSSSRLFIASGVANFKITRLQ